MILYLLALGSPSTRSSRRLADLDQHLRRDELARGVRPGVHLDFAPLFGHQYSHFLGRFPRRPRRLHARARHRLLRELAPCHATRSAAYAVANPLGWRGYGADCWGVTACDGPADVRLTYQRQHEALPQLRRTRRRRRARVRRRHLGADGGRVVAAVRARGGDPGARDDARRRWREPLLAVRLRRCLQPQLRRTTCRCCHGRVVPGVGWFDTDYLGIDQGPILAMLANYRDELGVEDDADATRTCSAACSARGSRGGWLEVQSRSHAAAHCARRSARQRPAGSAPAASRATHADVALLGDGPRGRSRARVARGLSSASIRASSVHIEQLPWTSAHEKLLTAFAGDATPDVAQIGNTWLAEMAALGALEPLQAWLDRTPSIDRADYFDGIWDTNVIDGKPLRRPVVRRHAPAVLPPRSARAEPASPTLPQRWDEWRAALAAVQRAGVPTAPRAAAAERVRAAARAGPAAAGAAAARRRRATATSRAPGSAARSTSTSRCSRSDSRRTSSTTQVANVWQEFGRGTFAFYITGPWNIGEFRRRLPAGAAVDLGHRADAGPRRARRLDRRRREPGDVQRVRRRSRRPGS